MGEYLDVDSPLSPHWHSPIVLARSAGNSAFPIRQQQGSVAIIGLRDIPNVIHGSRNFNLWEGRASGFISPPGVPVFGINVVAELQKRAAQWFWKHAHVSNLGKQVLCLITKPHREISSFFTG